MVRQWEGNEKSPEEKKNGYPYKKRMKKKKADS